MHDDRRVLDGTGAGRRRRAVSRVTARTWSLRRARVTSRSRLGAVALREVGDEVVGRRAVVPDVEGAHAGVLVDVLAVDAHRLEHDVVALGGAEAVLPRDDVQAGGEALDVPLPRTGSVSSKSLMSNTTLRSGVAKVPKLATWASPHACTVEAGDRRGREVHRHDRGAAAEERERRRRHAVVAHRDELGDARAALLLEHRDRVAVARFRRPSRRAPSAARRPAARGRPPAGRRRCSGAHAADPSLASCGELFPS